MDGEIQGQPAQPPRIAVPQRMPRASARVLVRAVMWSLPLLVLAAAAFVWLHSGRWVSTDNAYVKGDRATIAAELSGPIVEIAIQIGIYAGFTASEDAIEAAREVFIKTGAKVEDEGERNDSLEELTLRGADLMEQLHGDRARQGYAAPGNNVTGSLYPLAIQYGYGEIWFRPGLDLRRRALVAVAAFTALKLDGQVKKFGQSALNMGLSRTEVIEAIIQTAPLTGFAPALNALGGLSEALS